MKLPPLTELRTAYVEKGRPLPADIERALRQDGRAAAVALLAAVEKRRKANRAEGQRLRHLLKYEQPLWKSGLLHVAGIDEAGMSPLAGPVAAGAVILPEGFKLTDIDDSKKLDPATREALAVEIKTAAICWHVAFVEPEEIDTLNIYWAGIAAMKRAVGGLKIAPDHLLIDARKLKDVPIPQTGIIRGDQKSISIAAASILAKTARDARMRELDRQYPGYGFAQHKGYPVAEHQAALKKLGATPIHRRTFAPVRKALGLPPLHGPATPADAGDGEGTSVKSRAPRKR